MKNQLLFCAIILLFSACTENAKMNNLLDAHQADFYNNFQERKPVNLLNISYLDSLLARVLFIKSYQLKLEKIDSTQLDALEKREWIKFHKYLEKDLAEWQAYFHNPHLFDVTIYLQKDMLANEFQDTLTYLRQLQIELPRISPHFERVKQIISTAQPRHCNLAVQKQILFLHFLDIGLPKMIAKSALIKNEKEAMLTEIDTVKLAVKDFIGFCESLSFEYYEREIRMGE